ncbi:SPX-domain-containing protein [Atractiella rhizophila]|nr:SPX-domain-containing protein [Atractiella rhizophila]
MKFGAAIKNATNYVEWGPFYISYGDLKKYIKRTLKECKGDWGDQEETAFIELLEKELDKINGFQLSKIQEIKEHIQVFETRIKDLVEEADKSQHPPESSDHVGELANGEPNNEDLERGDTDDDDEGSVDEGIENRFLELEEDLANVICDVHELARFTQWNYTGFMKITKKHDKKTGRLLRAQFVSEYLNKQPFYRENYDDLIIQLSRLYNLVRTRGHPVVGDASAGASQNAFTRQTTKYWVHKDNFVELKLIILQHLPVLVFNPDKPFQESDSAISSIYFDNESLDLYLGRLEKNEGAEAIRLRWYGPETEKTIFVERKTHREDWTGEKSVKARVSIKEGQVNDYLSGKLSLDATFDEMKKKGKKSEKEVEGMKRLAKEVQKSVAEKNLQPVMRTFYNRTAFQLPGDARVRISFDTELSLIREDNWGRERAGKNWRRTDIGIDYPFEQLPEEDIHRFPYGVLEVKLQTQLGQEPPEWVRDLVSSHLVEAVPKFSKFITGCAMLLPERVELLPFWLPQMDIDIKKEPTENTVGIERPSGLSSSALNSGTTATSSQDSPTYGEPVSEDEEDTEALVDRYTSTTKDEENESAWTHLPREDIVKARQRRESTVADRALLDAPPVLRRKKELAEVTKLTPQKLQKILTSKLENSGKSMEPHDEGQRIEYTSTFRAPENKRISVPVRVEPKVFFALERTTLGWLEFSVVISAIAISFLNYGNDWVASVASILFTATALVAIAYTAYTHVWRVLHVRNKMAVDYHDYVGPTVLGLAVFSSVLLTFILKLAELVD